MVLTTMGLCRSLGRNRVAPEQIDSSRHRFEMIGADAPANPTQMVGFQAGRDWTFESAVGIDMRPNHLLTIPELTVAAHAVDVGRP